MNTAQVRLSALTIVTLIIVGAVVVFATSSQKVDGTEVRAEFTDGWPLVEGMSVRMSGGVVGTVNRLDITDEGRALAIMDIDPGAPPLGADASVAVRQQDLLGDTYLDLSPGRSARPLRETIPVGRTIARPRLDDVVGTFTPEVRLGFQTYVLEIAAALEQRGADLNDTILRLRPGLQATSELLAEFKGQNRSLERALTNARKVTSQVAARDEDLDAAVRSISETTSQVATATPAMREALSRAPTTLSKAETSLRGLRTMLEASRPVTAELERNAPRLDALTDSLIRFPKTGVPALTDLAALVDETRSTVKKGGPTFQTLAGTDFGLLPRAGAGVDTLSQIASDLVPAVIGDPVKGGGYYGGVPRTERWPTDPKTDPARAYFRAKAVMSCEIFGVPIEPGCLTKAGRDEDAIPPLPLTATPAERRRAARQARDEREYEQQQQAVVDYLLGP